MTDQTQTEGEDVARSSMAIVEKLEDAVAAALGKEDGRQILNRSQQLYEYEEGQVKLLDGEGKDLDSRIARGERAMRKMGEVLELMKKNRTDIEVMREGHLEIIASLRKRGVTLPA